MGKIKLTGGEVLGAVQFGVITPNEARALFGFEPMEEPKSAIEAVEATPAE